MSSTAILFSANSGVAGDLNDTRTSVVESRLFLAGSVPAAFGLPVKISSDKVAAIEDGDTAADFYGILTRSAPRTAGGVQITNSGQPNGDQPAGIVVGGPGYVLVKCTIGTPTIGGAVYMRVLTVGPNLSGDLEADSDANNVLLPNVVWSIAGTDSNNVTCVRIG